MSFAQYANRRSSSNHKSDIDAYYDNSIVNEQYLISRGFTAVIKHGETIYTKVGELNRLEVTINSHGISKITVNDYVFGATILSVGQLKSLANSIGIQYEPN